MNIYLGGDVYPGEDEEGNPGRGGNQPDRAIRCSEDDKNPRRKADREGEERGRDPMRDKKDRKDQGI